MPPEPFTMIDAVKAPTSILALAALAIVLAMCIYLYANQMA
jgi:hypothetical protein